MTDLTIAIIMGIYGVMCYFIGFIMGRIKNDTKRT